MAQIIDIGNNDVIFATLKKTYANLGNFNCLNNVLTYNNKNLNLGNVELRQIDKSLFNLPPDVIYYTLVKEVYAINNPDFLKKQVIYMNDVITHVNVDEKESLYVKQYTEDYLYEENLLKIFNDETLSEDKRIRIIPINNAYDGNLTPGKKLIQDLIIESSNKSQQQSQTKSHDKVKTLSRTKGNIVYYDYDPDVSEDVNRISGFANTILVVIMVCLLGLIMGFILIKYLL